MIYGNEKTAELLEIALEKGIPALLVGPTGSGKNTILRHIAQKHDRQDIIRISLTGETTVDDLIGHYQIKEHNTVHQDGSVTHAVRNGHILVLDEVNAAQPEVLFALQSLLDDDHSLTLTSHDNSVVEAHPNFRVFATMNPSSGYAGTKSMNKAFLSRFGLVVHVDYISSDEERKLIRERVPKLKEDDVLIMLETARVARRMLANDELTFPLSTRDLLNWAEMTYALGNLVAAFEHTIVTKAETDGSELHNILNLVIRENQNNTQYLKSVLADMDELAEQKKMPVKAQSLFQQDIAKAMAILDAMRKIACDQDQIKVEVVAEVRKTQTEVRKKLKTAAEKLAEEAQALDAKQKETFQKGYDTAKAEIYQKLGIPIESKE